MENYERRILFRQNKKRNMVPFLINWLFNKMYERLNFVKAIIAFRYPINGVDGAEAHRLSVPASYLHFQLPR